MMKSRRRNATLTMLVLTATLGMAACESEDAPTDRTAPAPADDVTTTDTALAPSAPGTAGGDAADTGTRGALPTLFSIMVELQGDMTRISQGLWVEDYETIASGARGIAEHPEIPPGEAQQIAAVLGDDMERFAELDGVVHDLSERLAEEAAAQDLDAIMETDAAMRQACVECHTEFRDRLRAEIGSPTP